MRKIYKKYPLLVDVLVPILTCITIVLLVCCIATNKKIESNLTQYSNAMDNLQKTYEDLETEYQVIVEENEKMKELCNVSKVPTYTYTKKEVYILAQCVQAEAGKENYEAQKMITQVILNRLESKEFPNNLVDIIYQKNHGIQFSVAYDGRLSEQKVTNETMLNVLEVLMYGYDLPEDVQYFYASSLKESNWVKSLKTYKTVEGTIFAYNRKA